MDCYSFPCVTNAYYCSVTCSLNIHINIIFAGMYFLVHYSNLKFIILSHQLVLLLLLLLPKTRAAHTLKNGEI